jgi:hypothetical protein
MKAILTTALLAASSAVLLAAPATGTSPLSAAPKNLARQHYGANLSRYDAATQRYVATEAAAAWLDDDVATGVSPLIGKQHYLLQLNDSHLLTNFALSTRGAKGTISLYTADEAAAPGDQAWKLAAKDISVASIDNKKLAHPLNKTAKYVLIETNIADPAPAIDGIYLYGDKSAASESIVKRPEPVDVKAVAGEFSNEQTSFNLSSLYAKAKVTFAAAEGGAASWQRVIDDNPESLVNLKPTTNESGLIVKFDGTHPISRLSVLADNTAKGKLDIFLLSQAPENNQPLSIEGLAPSATIALTGTTGRAATDDKLPQTDATAMILRWTPEIAGTPLALREVNTFADDLTLANYVVSGPADAEKKNTEVALNNEGKQIMPIGEGKESKDFKSPIGEAPPDEVGESPRKGFSPGRIGFPPSILRSPLSN